MTSQTSEIALNEVGFFTESSEVFKKFDLLDKLQKTLERELEEEIHTKYLDWYRENNGFTMSKEILNAKRTELGNEFNDKLSFLFDKLQKASLDDMERFSKCTKNTEHILPLLDEPSLGPKKDS